MKGFKSKHFGQFNSNQTINKNVLKIEKVDTWISWIYKNKCSFIYFFLQKCFRKVSILCVPINFVRKKMLLSFFPLFFSGIILDNNS